MISWLKNLFTPGTHLSLSKFFTAKNKYNSRNVSAFNWSKILDFILNFNIQAIYHPFRIKAKLASFEQGLFV